jgi:hypothetical protein
LDRLSVNSERSYAGRLVSAAFAMSVSGSNVEYAVEAALEIALTKSVSDAAGFAASADNADSRSVRLCPDVAESPADETGSVAAAYMFYSSSGANV